MIHRFRILISDKNRRIRQYLSRELKTQGYCILEIETEIDLWAALEQQDDIDLIIFDPEIVRGDPEEAFLRLKRTKPELPIIIHTFGEEPDPEMVAQTWPHLVIKSGPSAERLKKAVDDLLSRGYPERYEKRRPSADPEVDKS